MSGKRQIALYVTIAVWMVSVAATVSVVRSQHCCEAPLSDSGWVTDVPPEDSTSGFGGLVWAKTRNGIQLRFGYTLADGVPWTPLLAPEGTEDSRQAASLRLIFGGGS